MKLPTSTPVSTPNIIPTFTDLDSDVRHLFISIFLTALTNRDSILREIRNCICSKDEERCRKLNQQVHAHWKSLSTQNGSIFVDNWVSIPNSIKEAVTDVLHVTLEVGGWLSWQIACGAFSATETYSIGFACVKHTQNLVRISNQSYRQIIIKFSYHMPKPIKKFSSILQDQFTMARIKKKTYWSASIDSPNIRQQKSKKILMLQTLNVS